MAYNILFIVPHLCQPLVIIVKKIFCPHELLNFLAVMSSFILVLRILSKALYIFIYLQGLMVRVCESSSLEYLSWFTI